MNLIIDCNQASRLPTDRGKTRSHSLIVSPAVLAEIFLRTDPNPTLNRIRHYHFTIGLEIADVMFELSRLSSEEISSFQPFYSQRNTYQEDYEGLIEGIYKPTLDHVNWAAGMKARHRQSCEGLTAQSEPARKEIREAVRAHRRVSEKTGSPAEEKPSNYKDLLPYDSSKEFVYDLLTQSLV